jgi:hypothetical protein
MKEDRHGFEVALLLNSDCKRERPCLNRRR